MMKAKKKRLRRLEKGFLEESRNFALKARIFLKHFSAKKMKYFCALYYLKVPVSKNQCFGSASF